jgi:hypothetical protein
VTLHRTGLKLSNVGYHALQHPVAATHWHAVSHTFDSTGSKQASLHTSCHITAAPQQQRAHCQLPRTSPNERAPPQACARRSHMGFAQQLLTDVQAPDHPSKPLALPQQGNASSAPKLLARKLLPNTAPWGPFSAAQSTPAVATARQRPMLAPVSLNLTPYGGEYPSRHSVRSHQKR